MKPDLTVSISSVSFLEASSRRQDVPYIISTFSIFGILPGPRQRISIIFFSSEGAHPCLHQGNFSKGKQQHLPCALSHWPWNFPLAHTIFGAQLASQIEWWSGKGYSSSSSRDIYEGRLVCIKRLFQPLDCPLTLSLFWWGSGSPIGFSSLIQVPTSILWLMQCQP